MSQTGSKIPLPIAAWIVLCAFFNCIGWILSTVHELNRAGYLVAIVTGLAALLISWKYVPGLTCGAFKSSKLRRRFRRPFAMAFLLLAGLAILGGIIYAPTNYDALAYRTPRILNWLTEERWHWVHTEFQRLNTRTAALEWMWAPVLAFMRTDRWLFLFNAASFLLLPGLVFSMFTRVGVSGRVAWRWMWLLPTGYCYLLQAGSISNDMFGAVFSLAAVDFALRARKSGRVSEAVLSVLAISLLTAVKASNVCLLLPWMVLILPSWRLWLAKPVAMLATVPAAIGASFIPTAFLNWRACGDWTGLAAEQVPIGGGPIWLHLLNNSIHYTLQNLVPPIFPFASAWNHFADQIRPDSFKPLLEKYFETDAAHWRLPELQIEELAGLGFGVTILFGLSVLAGIILRRRFPIKRPAWDRIILAACIAPWLSLLYTMSKFGLAGAVRYLAPYYPLLMMGLLALPAHALIIKSRWWRAMAWINFALALLLVVISPSRPLWPARWFVHHNEARLKNSHLGSRAITVYGVYADRPWAFEPVLKLLPPDVSVLGFITFDDPETSLWRPFGSRRIVHVLAGESAEEIRKRHIKYILVHASVLHEPWDDWRRRVNVLVLHSFELRLRAGEPPSVWHLVEVSPAPP